MPGDQRRDRDDGLSRRQLLTRGAIAGGLVWAAPVIRTTAAYATTANGTERPCHDFFMVIFDPDGKVRPQPRDLYNPSVPVRIQHWFLDNPDVPVQFPAVPPLLTQAGNDAWAVLLPEVSGPNAAGRQCRMVIGWSEKDRHYAEGYVDPNPPLAVEVGRRLIFPCPEPRRDEDAGDDHRSDATENQVRASQSTATAAAPEVPADATTAPEVPPTATPDVPATAIADGALGTDTSLSGSGAPSETEAAGTVAGTISSDGSNSSGQVSSDGDRSPTVSSDGGPSRSTNPPPDSGRCINHVFLIYCCPR